MTIYTIQIAHAVKMGIDTKPEYLDVTVKTGDETFAPTWKMVMDYRKDLNKGLYVRRYYAKMRDSYRRNRARWDEVMAMDKVILACYCKPGAFCHRYLLKDIFLKLGAEYGGETKDIVGDAALASGRA